MKPLYAILLGILAASPVFAQTPAQAQPKLEFEVASIRASQSTGSDRVDAGLHMDGSQAHLNSFSLKNLIAMAYRVHADRISAPDWLSSERFDISAKLPDGATTDQIPEMVQSLLAERFQLTVHRESKEMAAYALVPGKSELKLAPSPPDSAPPAADGQVNVAASGSAAGVSIDLGHGSSFSLADDQFVVTKITMDVFAGELARYMDRPVVNLTDLKGNYDLTLPLAHEDYLVLLIQSGVNAGVTLPPQALRLLDNGRPESLFDSLEKLGLHLDARKLPVDMIVVDKCLQTPTDN
jgi:uncharacterized protein (TIGR03435 family)